MSSDDFEEEDDEATISRRFFLQGMGLAMTCPLWSACEFVTVFDDEIVAQVAFSISDSDLSALSDVGGTACLDAGAQKLLLIRRDEDTVLATERTCPHQQLSMGPCEGNGRAAKWDAEKQELQCQWHGTTFGVDGEVVSGPSPRPLRVFPVDFDPESEEGIVYVVPGADQGESS